MMERRLRKNSLRSKMIAFMLSLCVVFQITSASVVYAEPDQYQEMSVQGDGTSADMDIGNDIDDMMDTGSGDGVDSTVEPGSGDDVDSTVETDHGDGVDDTEEPGSGDDVESTIETGSGNGLDADLVSTQSEDESDDPASEPLSLDGSQSGDSVMATHSIQWISGSSSTIIEGNSLTIKPDTNNGSSVTAQVNFSMGGEESLSPGTVEIRLPASIFYLRNGNPTGTIYVPLPLAPSTDGIHGFNYRIDTETNEIVLSNLIHWRGHTFSQLKYNIVLLLRMLWTALNLTIYRLPSR